MPQPSLLERVQAGLVVNKPGMKPWHSKLPAKTRAEVEAVRKWFHSAGNRTPIRSVARSLVAQLKAQKFAVPSSQTVEVWLREKA